MILESVIKFFRDQNVMVHLVFNMIIIEEDIFKDIGINFANIVKCPHDLISFYFT